MLRYLRRKRSIFPRALGELTHLPVARTDVNVKPAIALGQESEPSTRWRPTWGEIEAIAVPGQILLAAGGDVNDVHVLGKQVSASGRVRDEPSGGGPLQAGVVGSGRGQPAWTPTVERHRPDLVPAALTRTKGDADALWGPGRLGQPGRMPVEHARRGSVLVHAQQRAPVTTVSRWPSGDQLGRPNRRACGVTRNGQPPVTGIRYN